MGQAKRRKNPDGSYKFFKGDAYIGNQGNLGKRLMVAARRGLYNMSAFQRVLSKRMGAGR